MYHLKTELVLEARAQLTIDSLVELEETREEEEGH